MSFFRRLRAAILAASLSVLALGAFAAPAHAHHPYAGSYCRDRFYGNTLQYYPTARVYSRSYRTTPDLASYNGYLVPVGYPVTLYDAFGWPVALYGTNYTTFLR